MAMTIEDVNVRFESFVARFSQAHPQDADRVRKAYEYARDAHAGLARLSGEPYIMHPEAVAEIVFEMGLDAESVMAALLHDVIEDTPHTYAEIEREFGTDVAQLVEGVTKLTRTKYTYKEDEQMENLRKMFLAMAKDIRVILVKIADRLHNMRTSGAWSEPKRREKALETMEIYAPLAHRLGISKIKWELEDIALQCLDPIGYKEITDELEKREKNYSHFLENITTQIREELEANGIKAEIQARVKHVYSIYRKMYNQHKSWDEIYDLYAVRIIVDDIADCYNALGQVHYIYKPMPGRFKDYISTPKPNMYRSLHTTVIGREGVPFEVQIRTWEMHHTAEYGIAAHWKYKDGVSENKESFNQKLEWVRSLLETQEDTDSDEFLSTLKIDMFADEVFVFTPQGDVISLPAGATPIDFAYAIHSAVGNRMVGAKVGGRIVGYDYELKSGDIVEVITSKNTHGPSRGWLDIAKTSEARNKIRQWFKKMAREENIAEGRTRFEEQLKKMGVDAALLTEDVLPQVLKRVSFGTLDELYAAIGYGGITAMRAANRVKDELKRMGKLGEKPQQPTAIPIVDAVETPALPNKKPAKRTESGVVVEGVDNCLVKFSRCCTPVPGDDIIGFVTRGYGVSVHRKDCQNVKALASSNEQGRWINVSWAEEPKDRYVTGLEISARDRQNLVVDVMTALTSLKVTVMSVSAKILNDGYDAVSLVVEIADLQELKTIVANLSKIQGVVNVTRKGYEG